MTNKSFLTAYLLWLFTGVFGGHRWYLGKRWSAALQLLFSLFFILVLIKYAIVLRYSSVQDILDMYSFMLFHPIENISSFWKYFDNGSVLNILLIIIAWLIPLLLAFDLFWIYFKLKKQNKGLTQQQVEAFD